MKQAADCCAPPGTVCEERAACQLAEVSPKKLSLYMCLQSEYVELQQDFAWRGWKLLRLLFLLLISRCAYS